MTGVETALAVASLATTVIGTGVQAMASNQQAKYQAAVAEMNAKIAEQNAERATDRAFAEGQAQDRVNAGIFGEMINEQGGSGLSATSPSFALARKGARTLGRLDTLNVVQSGLIDAHNARVGAAQSRADASASRAAGTNALIAGGIQGVGQIAGGLGQTMSSGQTLGESLIGGSRSSPRRAGFTPR